MSVQLQEVTSNAFKLPFDERAELAHELIASLDVTAKSKVEKSWNSEIERRVMEIKSGKAQGRPAEDILAEIRAVYS